MRPLLDMDVIQIEITNACVHQCANCTRLVGHSKKPFFMEFGFFKKAVDSLIDYPKMIGIMGGEPLLHPQFPEMAAYLKSKIPDKMRCGLWSTLPKGKEKYGQIIADVFGNVLLNDHTLGNLYHSPVLVAAKEIVADEFQMWYLIDRCCIQNSWSASINPKGAFFCEVAAANDVVFEGPGGWTVSPDWWKKTPKDYVEQMMQYCVNCSAALPLHARIDTDETDDISKGNLERLIKVGSPKIKKGKYSIYNKGERDRDYHINEFRNNIEYSMKIANKYGLSLKKNKLGYLQPFLISSQTCPDTINIEDFLQKGHSHHQAGNLIEASALYQKILEQQPEHIEANFLLGTLNLQAGNFDKAAEFLKKTVSLKPDHSTAYNNLGTVFKEQCKPDDAVKSYKKAITLRPDYAMAYCNLGNLLKDIGRFEESEESCRHAISYQHDYSDAHNNLASTLQKQGRHSEAIISYNMAIKYNPENINAHINRSSALLLTENFKDGWPEYEWRLHTKNCNSGTFHQTQWDGTKLNGKSILVHAEQGFGDTIQFIRYLPMIKRQGGYVIFACQKNLISLLKDCDGIDEIIEMTSEVEINFDTHIHLLSLPGIFGTNIDSIPSHTPYITVDPELAEQWRLRFANTNDFKIGIVWAGRPTYKDHYRSCSLDDFAPLAEIPGVTFYSLQKGPASDEILNPPKDMKIINLDKELTDFSDTAAVMNNLNLIISTDTAVVHLAGAMGKPIWSILHMSADWRWFLDRNKSPWYPTMRLFRQTKFNNWKIVFDQTSDALLQILNDSKKTAEHNKNTLQHSSS